MARIVLEQVSKEFAGSKGRPIPAVRELNLAVEERELLVLAGPSGCGKTTTLRIIAGLERPSQGTISIDGKIVNDVPARDRDVAMVFQNLALYPHMTAYENMEFGLKARKHRKEEIVRRINEAAAILGLHECIDRRPSELSGGQRQRVALGRAIVLQPKVLLLDEPLSNLDAPLRARIREELARLHRQLRMTMIYVTHDQMEAMSLGERVAVMNGGELQQIEAPREIYRKPGNLFVAGFFGTPGMNLFWGKIVRKGERTWFEEEVEADAKVNESEARGETVKTVKQMVTGLDTPQKGGVNERELQAENVARLAPFTMEITREVRSNLSALAGSKVVMGIRPENVSVVAATENGTISAWLERVERLGAESYLHVRTAGHRFVVRARGDFDGTQRELRVGCDMREACFFDANSGRSTGAAELKRDMEQKTTK